MNLDTNFHSVFLLNYHLVFVTKYRKKVIDDDISNRLKEIFEKMIKKPELKKEIEKKSKKRDYWER